MSKWSNSKRKFNLMKIRPLTVMYSVLLCFALAAAAPLAQAAETNATKASTELFNEVVAKGDGVKVTRSQLDDALITIRASAAARGQRIPPQAMRRIEARVLSQMIGIQLLNPRATAADKAAGVENAQKQLELMKEAAGSEEDFDRQLKTVGMKRDELVAKMTEEATADAVLRRELSVEVKDGDVKKFYEENPTRFEKPELVRAAHILIGTTEEDGAEMTAEAKKEKLALAEKLKERAEAGEDFSKLAEEYSDDPGSKNSGGEYTFPRGQMVPEFEAVAFSQDTNHVSDVVTTRFGYHIIKTLEKIPSKTVPFDEAAPQIKRSLELRAMSEKVPAFMNKLETAAHLEILDEELKAIIDDANAAAQKASTATQE